MVQGMLRHVIDTGGDIKQSDTQPPCKSLMDQRIHKNNKNELQIKSKKAKTANKEKYIKPPLLTVPFCELCL